MPRFREMPCHKCTLDFLLPREYNAKTVACTHHSLHLTNVSNTKFAYLKQQPAGTCRAQYQAFLGEEWHGVHSEYS